MKLGMYISYADHESEDTLEELQSVIVSSNRHRDEYIDCNVEQHVDHYRSTSWWVTWRLECLGGLITPVSAWLLFDGVPGSIVCV